MGKSQRQVIDLKAMKGISKSLSKEYTRDWTKQGKENAMLKGNNYDFSRSKLNFEVGRGGVIKSVDTKKTIEMRMKELLAARNIEDPNQKYKEPRIRTVASFILGGSREQMRRLAFGDQEFHEGKGADNSHLERKEEIEKWAVDAYNFMAEKYGEENIACFIVHLDETNPHVHCAILPITQENKFSFKQIFHGETKYSFQDYMRTLHTDFAKVNAKWGLERGSNIAETGARHRSTEEYLRDLDNKRVGKEKKLDSIQSDIDLYKGRRDNLRKDVDKLTRKVRGLTTMIKNLQFQLESARQELAVIEQLKLKGEGDTAAIEKRQRELKEEIQQLIDKIEDKEAKLAEAKQEMQQVRQTTEKLEERKTHLQAEVKKVFNDYVDANRKTVGTNLAEMLTEDAKYRFGEMAKENADALDFFEGGILKDLADRGASVLAVGTALFMGMTNEALEFSESHGGGGGVPANWGREDDEDDRRWSRRCLLQAASMLRPQSKKKAVTRSRGRGRR